MTINRIWISIIKTSFAVLIIANISKQKKYIIWKILVQCFGSNIKIRWVI